MKTIRDQIPTPRSNQLQRQCEELYGKYSSPDIKRKCAEFAWTEFRHLCSELEKDIHQLRKGIIPVKKTNEKKKTRKRKAKP